MEKHVEERFERIESTLANANETLDRCSALAEECWTLSRENQKRLDIILAKMDEHIEEMKRDRQDKRPLISSI